MTLSSVALSSPSPLDDLFEAIGNKLRITPTQFELAEGHYQAVGRWLADDDSPLARLRPELYPQGSAALQTTVRPRGREEYDLDVVLQTATSPSDAMALYRLVEQRLRAHRDYARRLTLKPRCLRLAYEHDFHVDILPARHDSIRGGTCIEVPDRNLRDWKPSNPKGYVAWFGGRSAAARIALEKRQQAPLPTPVDDPSVLRRATQLIKRRRDNMFYGRGDAPRSIILTTLTAMHYFGEDSITDAVLGVLSRIEDAVSHAAPGRLKVVNPTNVDEDFSESWNDSATYERFVRFIQVMRRELQGLVKQQGLDTLASSLNGMFGDELGKGAVQTYVEKVRKAREESSLRFSGPAIITGSEKGQKAAPHTFHHRA